MTVTAKPLVETTHEAIAVLSEKLGIVETVRFLTQFGTGFGDYTRDRDTLFSGLSMDEIMLGVRRTGRLRPNKRIQAPRKKHARR